MLSTVLDDIVHIWKSNLDRYSSCDNILTNVCDMNLSTPVLVMVLQMVVGLGTSLGTDPQTGLEI